ncbi:DUF1413 domain-containing protein [Cupriavidus sp. D39]|uniref:DUF1413 domain-containing protein n=1 Tax=Cupriavidus sp. D39 TaxID=2997877 RepID=UPI003B63CD96
MPIAALDIDVEGRVFQLLSHASLLPAGTEFTVPSINEQSYPGEWTHIALPVRQRIGRMFRKEVDGRQRTTFASGFARIRVTAGKNELGQTIYKTFTA